MTDKLYTPRPVRVSKAPPPIFPISTKQNILPDLPPVPPPNWGKWAYMRDIELWEAAALSLNLEPDKLPVYLGAFDKFRDDPFRICPTPFLERLLVANSNCGISLGFKPVHELKARCLVDLPEFAAWAVNLNIPNLPPELVALAATTKHPVPAQHTKTPAHLKADVHTSDGVLDWKNTVRAEAWEQWVKTLAENGTPNLENVAKYLANWCVTNMINGNLGKPPSAGYIQTHVICGKYWEPPRNMSREAAKKHLEQKKQGKEAK